MAYAINHVHIRSTDPHASASWYEKHFGAKIVSEREVMPGTITISMEVGGPVRLNISSKPEGTSDERAVAELNRLGLEHFGFNVEDLEAELGRLERANIRIVLPLTEVGGGTRLAYIEGPDDVLIELVQRPNTTQ
jgi:catechol 2,3-dioxygenase-like lactoylglutathione lyase family enzyme